MANLPIFPHPTADGYYWWRYRGGTPEVVEVCQVGAGPQYWWEVWRTNSEEPYNLDDGEFLSGKLPQPDEDDVEGEFVLVVMG